jgi:glutaminyl-tRNA synthetase
VDIALLEHCLREDLNARAQRMMVVLHPLRLVIDNYPEGQEEELDAVNNPEDPSMGTRKIPFSRVLYIEKEDFREDPPKKWFRLAPGQEIRLKHAYYVTCTDVIKDERTGEVVELHCTYDPESRGGWTKDERRVRGTLHWVSSSHSFPVEVRLYDYLFTAENPGEAEEGSDFKSSLNPNSLDILSACQAEPSLKEAEPGTRYQFLRQGYFCVDTVDSAPDALVFNRTATLRDTWAKIEKALKMSEK